MGTEARFQAIPEDCELLQRARKDLNIAEKMPFFNMYATDEFPKGGKFDPDREYFYDKVKEMVAADPGLLERYFYAGYRTYGAIMYLLSPYQRTGEGGGDGLIGHAFWGTRPIHESGLTGTTMGLVPKEHVKVIADYLDQITLEQLHEHYDPPKMEDVYKMHATDGEERFLDIWEEFVGMRNVYRAAANHNEAVITVIA